MEIPGAQPGMSVVADADVEFVSIDVAADGRTLSVRIILRVHVKVIAVRNIHVITNVAGVPGIHIEKALVRVQEVLGEDKAQEIVRELIDIPDEKPLAAAVLNCASTPEVKRTIVAPGKVIVDGVIAQRIIYEPLADPTDGPHACTIPCRSQAS